MENVQDMKKKQESDIKLGIKVRCLQQKCKLSSMQADHVASLLADHVAGRPDLRGADREMAEASGVEKVILHGCVSCNDHVYSPEDKRVNCPRCGGARYKDNNRTANEIVYYFPLRKRMESLLQLPNFQQLLQVCYCNTAACSTLALICWLIICDDSMKKQGKSMQTSFPTCTIAKPGGCAYNRPCDRSGPGQTTTF